MNIGKLRERIAIQSKGTSNGGSFGTSNGAWSDVKTVYAQFQGVSESEAPEQGQTVGITLAQFRIRKPSSFSVDTKMRIVFRGVNYYITGIRPAPAGDHVIVTAEARDNE